MHPYTTSYYCTDIHYYCVWVVPHRQTRMRLRNLGQPSGRPPPDARSFGTNQFALSPPEAGRPPICQPLSAATATKDRFLWGTCIRPQPLSSPPATMGPKKKGMAPSNKTSLCCRARPVQGRRPTASYTRPSMLQRSNLPACSPLSRRASSASPAKPWSSLSMSRRAYVCTDYGGLRCLPVDRPLANSGFAG
ncbi:hypothetical protein L209DRAFT_286871 [Thermothelomyces heterothallicus CBS 203.75]